MIAGVLALQGAFHEHQHLLKACGVDTIQVRRPEELEKVDALVIPGGESTTIGKLLIKYDLFDPLIERGKNGMPLMGTCAGLILLAREINDSDQPRLGLMDIKVERNAFGRQVDSFETDLNLQGLNGKPFRAVFIRAPYVLETKDNVEVIATFNNKIVCVKQDNLLGVAFHPELTGDTRLHKFFIENIKNEQ